MNWKYALSYIEGCCKRWEAFKKEFKGTEEEKKILEESYMVIFFPDGNIQVNLQGFSPSIMALFHSGVFDPSSSSKYFLSLIREKQRLKEEIKRIEQMIEKIERKLLSINTDNLELSPFHIELRFKSVDYNLIQKLKEWEGCNQEKTDKSPASIRIVLK